MLEKPESATKNKESRDIGHIGEIKKKTKNKTKQNKTKQNTTTYNAA
jgi:hypothetical protein